MATQLSIKVVIAVLVPISAICFVSIVAVLVMGLKLGSIARSNVSSKKGNEATQKERNIFKWLLCVTSGSQKGRENEIEVVSRTPPPRDLAASTGDLNPKDPLHRGSKKSERGPIKIEDISLPLRGPDMVQTSTMPEPVMMPMPLTSPSTPKPEATMKELMEVVQPLRTSRKSSPSPAPRHPSPGRPSQYSLLKDAPPLPTLGDGFDPEVKAPVFQKTSNDSFASGVTYFTAQSGHTHSVFEESVSKKPLHVRVNEVESMKASVFEFDSTSLEYCPPQLGSPDTRVSQYIYRGDIAAETPKENRESAATLKAKPKPEVRQSKGTIESHSTLRETKWRTRSSTLGKSVYAAQRQSRAAAKERRLKRQVRRQRLLNKPLPGLPGERSMPKKAEGTPSSFKWPRLATFSTEGVIDNLDGSLYRALVAYTPKLRDELRLEQGDQVKVFQVFDDGWCLAYRQDENKEVRGICPKTILERQQKEKRDSQQNLSVGRSV